MKAKTTNAEQNISITRIKVEKLFGYNTYDLQAESVDVSKLMIFYGDNGSGKTTLLKLLFNLLSPAPRRGHKTFVAGIRFKRISIYLTNGMTVLAERRNSRTLTGSYYMSIAKGGKVQECLFKVNERNVVPSGGPDERKQDAFLKQLSKLSLALYFLGDDRKVLSNIYSEEDDESAIINPDYIASTFNLEGYISSRRNDESEGLDIERAVERLVEWIRQQALTGSTIGEANANTIYTEIIKSIAKPMRVNRRDPNKTSTDELIETLLTQSKRNEAFALFGLTTPFAVDSLIDGLKTSTQQQRRLMLKVLTPYVDGIKARLDALESIQSSIATFIENINLFYSNKTVMFNLAKGLTIQTPDKEVLSPTLLSSGEKQLLLLFCNVLTAQDQQSIFIIDEPEISLNVKWQRQLVQALLDCIKEGKMQFILATHSLELLSLHQHNAVRLKNMES
jgi:energy-coupling factor transporter ATP-binding protein EcfA2